MAVVANPLPPPQLVDDIGGHDEEACWSECLNCCCLEVLDGVGGHDEGEQGGLCLGFLQLCGGDEGGNAKVRSPSRAFDSLVLLWTVSASCMHIQRDRMNE